MTWQMDWFYVPQLKHNPIIYLMHLYAHSSVEKAPKVAYIKINEWETIITEMFCVGRFMPHLLLLFFHTRQLESQLITEPSTVSCD